MEAPHGVYRIGDSGEAVAEIVGKLQRLGLLTGGHDVYDEATAHAVRGFQQQRGLIVDGRVGPVTERELLAARWTLGDRTLSFTLSAPKIPSIRATANPSSCSFACSASTSSPVNGCDGT